MKAKLSQITEAQFLKQILAMAHLYGWRSLHIRPAIRRSGVWLTPVAGDGKGFPDLLLLRGKKLIFAELKVGRNHLTDEQVAWMRALEAGGYQWHLWRPERWAEIEDLLAPEVS